MPRRIALTCIACAALAVIAGCTPTTTSTVVTDGGAVPTAGYSLDVCNPLPQRSSQPTTAAWLNAVSARVIDPALVGADVGASALLPQQRLVFVFGDTSRKTGPGAQLAVRNSMALFVNDCAYVVVAPGHGAVIPNRSDGVGYWPMSVLVSPRSSNTSHLTVTAQRVRSTGAGDFENLGPALAVFDVGSAGAPQLVSVTDIGPDDPSRARPCWGAAAYDGGDGWWYLYGTASPSQPGIFGWSVRVARTPVGRATELGQWQYWDGTTWGTDADAASELIAAAGGVSQTFSVFSAQHHIYAVSKKDGFLGSELAMWPMNSPTGPVAEPVTVGLIPNRTSPEQLLYMPLAHPEIPASTPDRVVVSISRNTTDLVELAEHPLLYRPYFVEIGLPPAESGEDLTPKDAPVGLPATASAPSN